MRKTIDIQKIKDKANILLTSDINNLEKSGVCMLIESLLNETKNYKGYSFNNGEQDIFNRKYS
jgi:hypothetical protein